MPDGYDTYIEQGGTNVSGGQKPAAVHRPRPAEKAQGADPGRLHLRRGHRAPTRRSARAFAQEIPDTTKFIIAQRVSSVQDADRILVMDEGQISGFGTHEELLTDQRHLPRGL